jgi:hypothetical protein
MLFPLSDGVWGMFFRGMVFGFSDFLAGLEIGIALIGAIVFFGLNALQGWGHHMVDQSKRGGAS